MRRMIPQKLINQIIDQLSKQSLTQEMLNSIIVEVDDEEIGGYGLNFASDGESFLTISGYAVISTTSACIMTLSNIPSVFLTKLQSALTYLGTNSLDGGESVRVVINNGTITGDITISFDAGSARDVFTSITLSSVYKEV